MIGMLWISKRRVERKIKKAMKKATILIMNTPKEYLKESATVRVKFGKHCYMDFKINNMEELVEIANRGDKNE